MNMEDIQKLREAAEAIAGIVKRHKAEGEAIRKALEPLRDVVEPRVVEKVVERWSEKPWHAPWPRPLPARYEVPRTTDPLPSLPPIYCGPNTCSTSGRPWEV